MPLPHPSLDAFLDFLCQYERVVIGSAGSSFFRSPLSFWLSQTTGRLVGTDGVLYGFADSHVWMGLPRWARLLSSRLESCAYESLTGEQVLLLLADLECMMQMSLL